MMNGMTEATGGQFLQFVTVLWKVVKKMDTAILDGWLKSPDRLFNVLSEALLPSQFFERDMHKAGWKLLEDVSRRINCASNVELVDFRRSGEISIEGDVMLLRALEGNNGFGQRDAEQLLHSQYIPEEWRDYFIVFPGTIWQSYNGRRYIPYIFWHHGTWYLDFFWLGIRWDGSVRLLSSRK